MSNTVDKRVVEMRFDNQQFESRASTTMGTLEKLKNALNFKSAGAGLDELDKKVKGVSFNPLAAGVEAVQVKFNALQVAAFTALQNITNRAVDAGISLAKSLSLDQLSAGWQKYADKTSAVQTIMAATKDQFTDTGEQMDYVNSQLEKLNWFTDETSYNFVDMVGNIGKFTSNNIALDDAVTSMQGIATWAAVSGANSEQASHAMYNLAQAIGVGAVKLQDWKSIETANMSTAEFKEMVLETAASLGMLKKQSDGVFKTIGKGTEVTVAKFSAALSEGWFTSDVLVKTLDQYGAFTNELYKISDATGETATDLLQWIERYRDAGESSFEVIQDLAKTTGLSVQELQGYMETLTDSSYELGERSFRAAQEAKTFQEAISATQDAVSTGWMKTFEIIFGDYEEARVRWTALANELWDIFASGAETRNELLEEALGIPDKYLERSMSSWDKLASKIEEVGIPTDAFIEKCKDIGDEMGLIDKSAIQTFDDFKESLSSGWLSGDLIAQAIDSFIGPLGTVNSAVDDASHSFERFKEVVNEVIRGEWGSGAERFEKFTQAGWNSAKMQEAVNKAFYGGQLTMEDYKAALSGLTDEQLKSAGYTDEQIQALRDLADEYSNLDGAVDGTGAAIEDVRTGSELLFSGISNAWGSIKRIFAALKEAWQTAFPPMTAERLYEMLGAFENLTARFDEWTTKKYNKLRATFVGLSSAIGIVVDIIKEVGKFVIDLLGPAFGSASDKVLDFTSRLGKNIRLFREWLQQTGYIRAGLEALKALLLSGVNAVKSWVSSFKELPAVQGWIATVQKKLESFVKMIQDSFPEARKKFDEFVVTLKEAWTTRDFSKITEPLKEFARTFKKEFLAAWDGFKASETFGPLINSIEKLWNTIKTKFVAIIDKFKSFGESVSNFRKTLNDSTTKIGAAFSKLEGVFAPVAEVLSGHIGDIIAALLVLVTAKAITSFARKLSKFIDTCSNAINLLTKPFEAIGGLMTEMKTALRSFSGVAKAARNALNGVVLLEVVAAIGGLAYIVVKLGEVPEEQLMKGLKIAGILGAVAVAILIVVAMIDKYKAQLNPSGAKKKASSMLKIVELATAVYLVAKAFGEFYSVFKDGKIGASIAAAGGIVVALVALVGAMEFLDKFKGGIKSTASLKSLIGVGIALKLVSSSFVDLYDALKDATWSEMGKTFAAFGGVVLAFLGMMAILARAKVGAGKGIGINLITSVIALKVLISVLKDLADPSFDLSGMKGNLGSIAVLVGSLIALMFVLSKLPSSAGTGASLLAASIAIGILVGAVALLGNMQSSTISKGVAAVSELLIFLGVFSLLANLTGKFSSGWVAVNLIAVSVAIGILAGVIVLLSLLDEQDVVVGTLAIDSMLICVGVMMALGSLAKNLALSQFIGISIVIGVLAIAVGALSLLDQGAVLSATLALDSLMVCVGIMLALSSLAKGLKLTQFAGLSLVILSLAGSVRLIGELESGVGKAVAAMGAMMTLFTVMSLLLGTAATTFNEAGPMGLIGIGICIAVVAACALVVAALANMQNVDVAIEIATSMGTFMAAVGIAMQGVADVGKLPLPALGTGLLGLIAVIGIIALLIAAIVALNELVPGAQEALNNALPLFRSIGNAIGQVIGGFIDGLFNLDTSSLVSQLTDFGDAMKNFADSAGGIGEGAVTGVMAIAAMLIALGASDLMNAITNLLGGKVTTLTEFSAQLPQFGTDLHDFGVALGDVNTDAMGSAATAAEQIANIAKKLPSKGGWKAKILGDKETMAEFGADMLAFGAAVKEAVSDEGFGTLTDDKIGKITSAATAAEAVADLQKKLPSSGGLIQRVLGEPETLTEFGVDMLLFAQAVKQAVSDDGFGTMTQDQVDKVNLARDAVDRILDLQAKIPDKDGWLQNIFRGGTTTIDDFGEQMVAFASALIKFTSSDKGLGAISDWGVVDTAITELNKIIDLGTNESLETVSSNLKTLGPAVSALGNAFGNGKGVADGFYSATKGIDTAQLDGVISELVRLIGVVGDLSTFDATGTTNFSTALETLAQTGIDDFCSAFENCSDEIQNAVDSLINTAILTITLANPDFLSQGTDSANSYLDGIASKETEAGTTGSSLAEKVTDKLDNAVKDFKSAGEKSADEYLKNIQKSYHEATTTGQTLGKNVIDQLTNILGQFTTAGTESASKYIDAILSYQRQATNAGATLKNAVVNGLAAYESARQQGNNVGSGFIAGLSGWGTSAYNSAYSIGRSAIRGLQAAVNAHSPSRESMKIADYTGIGYVDQLLEYAKKAFNAGDELGSAALDGMRDAVSKVTKMFGDEASSPVIRPVVDLSGAMQSAKSIDDMFNRSVTLASTVAAQTGATVTAAKARTENNAFGAPAATTAETPTQISFNNKFEITSNDPEEVANRVSYILQRQVERKESVWA